MRRICTVLGFTLLTLAMSHLAHATPVTSATYYFTSDHCTGGCLTGQTSGGTVTVTDNLSGTLSFVVALSNGNQFVDTGFQVDFGFNLDGISPVLYSGLSSGWSIPGGISPSQNAGSYQMDGTGDFEFGVLCSVPTGCGPGGSNPFAGPLDFSIFASGLSLSSLTTNAKGQLMAVDMISGTTGKTGAVDVSPGVVTTPDGGATVTLLGSALLGLGMFVRRFGKR